eukprot:4833699-Karenia_brevis.AAC.1
MTTLARKFVQVRRINSLLHQPPFASFTMRKGEVSMLQWLIWLDRQACPQKCIGAPSYLLDAVE